MTDSPFGAGRSRGTVQLGAVSLRVSSLLGAAGQAAASPMSPPQPFVRDPKNPIDEEYTKKIKEYTTEPFFLSPLVDYLPASKTRADAEGRARRHRRRARQAAVLEGGLRVHAAAREGERRA